MELQTDREILVQLSSDVKHLTQTIKAFGEDMKELEVNKINKMQDELSELKTWKSQFGAVLKVLTVIATAIGTVAGYLISLLFK